MTEPNASRGPWSTLGMLAVLLALAAGMRLWHYTHTEVAARDSVGFIRLAWQLEHQPWPAVLHHSHQHPAYPVLVLLASLPVRLCVSGSEAVVMQHSAQLVSVIAGVLVVLPIFFLGRELFSRGVGFWVNVLVQCLPVSSRLLSDGLSEATFLLFAVSGLYFAARVPWTRSPEAFALCGLFGALAYLTRPEGGLVVAATGLVLLGGQAVPAWRQPWRGTVRCGICLGATALVLAVPYMVVIGGLTVKPSVNEIGIPGKHSRPGQGDHEEAVQGKPPVLLASLGPVLGLWDEPVTSPTSNRNRVVWGLQALAVELFKGFYYVLWVPALFGLVWFRDRLRTVPGAWVVLLLCGIVSLMLWRLSSVMGYVSDRHALLVILGGFYWAVAGLAVLGRGTVALLRRWAGQVRDGTGFALRHAVLAALVLAVAGLALPKTVVPLHANRGGFREAGVWLGDHVTPNDLVLDPYAWSGYYAGLVFQENTPKAPREAGYYYVVFDALNRHPNLREHLKAQQMKDKGQLVYAWEGHRGKERGRVEIYAIPLGPRP